MAEWNVPMFLRLHELALREHYDYAAMTKWVNTEVEKANAMASPADQRAFVTKQQLLTHFTKHIPVEEVTRSKVKKATKIKTQSVEVFDPIVERKLKELTDHAAAVGVEDLDDFQRYHATLRRMQKRFDALDEFFDAKDFVPEKDLMMAYKSFGDSIARMLKESIHMRQQEQIFHNAVESALDKMSLGSLESILKSVDRAYVQLRPLCQDPQKADAVMGTLRENVGICLSSGSKTALDHLKTVLKVE
jgi:hypothetical protein